ncbi:Gfo/Idh/MocA family protein [Candidatus Soleaferrea massiliensis]|uniref:Gfo/Idh/MocA family protein n=1 Tax=Candidatus Soleaferrea massiliensis TaxID=1470354 RepID=UPI00058F0F46|nr:Gfo/Idh/MocA family oxidoreductase [Candidatus Soleaferrea massiliensis]
MAKTINWGIIGTGWIADKMATALNFLEDANLAAVGSRTLEKAQRFAQQFQIPRAYGSYEELAADPDIDIIYIATPHSEHYANVKLCLENGKHVLNEKAFCVNKKQAEEVIELAREKKLFLMEALWTRFQPAANALVKTIRDGVIGDVHMLKAELCFLLNRDKEFRLLNPNLAGGALLDVGIYPITMASLVFGSRPQKVVTHAVMGETGVDERDCINLFYEDGKFASLVAAIDTEGSNTAYIYGTKGQIMVPQDWCPESFTVKTYADNKETTYKLPFSCNGYEYEAACAMDCIREGKLESEIMPHSTTLEIMELLDSIRDQWGLRYPFE